jgi:hypothetical protein
MKTKFFLTSLSLVSLLSGCAPSLGLRLGAPDVAFEEKEQSKVDAQALSGAKVKVGSFLDARASDTIVVVDGREVRSEGEIGAAVQAGLERQLRDAGARIALLQAPTIDGEVIEWRAKVTPDFPASEVVAKAKIKITLRGPKSEVLYRSTYVGDANKKHPFLGEKDVQATLGNAMASAIEVAVQDETLIGRITAR